MSSGKSRKYLYAMQTLALSNLSLHRNHTVIIFLESIYLLNSQYLSITYYKDNSQLNNASGEIKQSHSQSIVLNIIGNSIKTIPWIMMLSFFIAICLIFLRVNILLSKLNT